MSNQFIANFALLVPLGAAIAYYDVRYRRIPNRLVLATLAGGLVVNAIFGGWGGVRASLVGCVFAFGLMFIMHVFGAMGAGDVKLFAAVGAIIGAHLVLTTFSIVLITGAALAVFSMLRAGTARATMQRVWLILGGLLPGWKMPRFPVPADRKQTLPYGVAITLGSLISLFIFRA
ncbi:MAG: A24 family peptidase [Blastocatellia bacterium]